MVGTKKRASRSNQETNRETTTGNALSEPQAARLSFRFQPIRPSTKSGQLMCYRNRTT